MTFFNWFTLLWLVIAAGTFVLLLYLSAPYGRHNRQGWGPSIDNKLGWVLMEAPASLGMFCWFWSGEHNTGAVAWLLLIVWQIHYVHRSFIYPFTLRGKKRMPVLIALLAVVFNFGNSYLNGYWLFTLSGGFSAEYLTSPRLWLGLGLFAAGFIVTKQSDAILRNLRKPGETGYKIPRGGMYRFVSAPNYLGEIIQWTGWAIATWSLPTLTFLIWTVANLVPRARTHHAWYQQKFDDYPPERKALIPAIW